MKKILIIALILLYILNIHIPAAYADSLNIDTQACILIDSKSGQVLYEQNSNEKGLFPASTTKIMTAILAIERGDPDRIMTASQSAVDDIGKDGMNIGIMAGEELRMENLLEALLISSANETANIIAENICSTREEFVGLMNQKALELGAENTHFANPCGAHDPNHYTTASDLAKIARYAMTLPKFREIVSKTEYTIPPTNKHDTWPTLYTSNQFLRYYQNDMFKITGIKTGYTTPAGFNLVSSAVNNDGIELIAVVMGVRNAGAKNNVNKYSEQLLEYGFRSFSIQNLVDAGQVIEKDVPVVDAEQDQKLDLMAESNVSGLLPLDKDKWKLVKEQHIESPVNAPVNQGDVLGYIEYKNNGITLGRTNIIASKTINKVFVLKNAGSIKKLTQNPLFNRVVIIISVILLLFLILRVVLRNISRRINSKKYRY